ncbi:MAG: arylsulfatase, partial [Planctomycetota bacterium]|nr:arylsulfatase [Planctomycetota bacterium]
MNRRDFLKAVSTGALTATISGCKSWPTLCWMGKQSRPNIIFILADDLGYGDLGCYGQKEIATPNIDRLAAEGIRFTDHYAGSTVCAPSRCCLMTGLHTGHCWIRGNALIPLRPSDVTVAELLKQAGYTTGIIGKWGLGETGTTGIPNKKGFDYWFGYLNQRHAHNYYPEFLWRNEESISIEGNKLPKPEPGGWGESASKVTYSPDLFTKEALSFVEQNSDFAKASDFACATPDKSPDKKDPTSLKLRRTSRPFFLYLAYTIPHANNEAGQNGMEVPSLGQYADKNWPPPQKGHAAMITRMDGDIGKLMAKLKKLGLDENTLVMFSSDNGPHKEGGGDPAFNKSSGPLRGYKRDLYEGGIRVPMLARWPSKIKAGSVSNHVSAFWDFLPTCCELAGVNTPETIDGISILPTLLGQPDKQKKHEFLYWEFHEQGKKQAVRMGDWKGVRLNVAKNPPAVLLRKNEAAGVPIELY